MRERHHAYSNLFLSCYNASTPCFLHKNLPIDLPDLRPSDILISAFLVFNLGVFTTWGIKNNNNNKRRCIAP